MDISSLLPLLLMQNGLFSGKDSSGGMNAADLMRLFGAMNGGSKNPFSEMFGNAANFGSETSPFANMFGNNPFSGAFGKNSGSVERNNGGFGKSAYRAEENRGYSYNKDNPSKDNLNAMFPEELLKMLRNLNRGR